MPSGRPGPPSELSSSQEYIQSPRWWNCADAQPSAASLQPSFTGAPFPYAPDQGQQNLAFRNPRRLQVCSVSPTAYHNCPPSSYHAATFASGHPVSRQGYNDGDIATSFRAVGDSLSGYGWPNPTGDGSHVNAMDESSRQSVQASSTKPCNPSAEEYGYSEIQQHCTDQSVLERTNALHGVGSGFNVSDGYYGSDSMKILLNRVSATDKCESISDNTNQNWNPSAIETNRARQSQWKNSQELGNPVDLSMIPAFGIDPSLLDKPFSGAYRSFVEDVDKTNIGAIDSQNEKFLHNSGEVDAHSPSDPSAFMAPTYDAESRDTLCPTVSSTAPSLYHGTHSQLVPEPSENCKICGEVFSGRAEWQKDNRRRHIREKHRTGQKLRYKCLLNKDGVACQTVVKEVRYRRKHVESVHQRESGKLPPVDANRRPNNETNKMLDKWFAKLP